VEILLLPVSQATAAQVAEVPVVVAEAAPLTREHAGKAVLAVTDSLSSTKYLHNEQGMRHTKWHRPQHHRP
jgi:hypothetical protein